MKVELLNATPNPEETICTAARNDYSEEYVGNQSFEETMETVDGDTLEEKKETLIAHLLGRGHYGCFEHPQATFGIKGVSRSCMAQLTRHRHVSFDVRSQRYVDFTGADPGELVVMPPSATDMNAGNRDPNSKSTDEICEAAFGKSQEALQDELDEDDMDYSVQEWIERERQHAFEESIRVSVEKYNRLRDLGMAPEDARFVLPIGSKVNIVMSLNVRMLLHVADLRAAGDAQHEIREMTERVLDEAAEWCPITFDYYEENMRGRKNRLAP